ncbi:reverse transcriptase domain-containing protein [Tanacetum coccineum]
MSFENWNCIFTAALRSTECLLNGFVLKGSSRPYSLGLNDTVKSWNTYAQPMGIEQANLTTWTELKRLLTNKYCPRTEIRKMEEELYNLSVKGNDLKPYVRRFQELTTLCPNMVPNNEKLLEAFIGGLPRSIEGKRYALETQNFGGRLHKHFPEFNVIRLINAGFYARNQ